MRRSSSGSSQEDDTDEDCQPEPSVSEDDGRKRSFTSAKFDITRQSITLDRRKVEKNHPIPQVAYDAPSPLQTQTLEISEKQRLSDTGALHQPSRMGQLHEQRRSRVRNPWKCSLLTLTTTALSSILILFIVHSFLTRQLDPKGCNNCRMRPAYAKLSGFDTEHTRFASKYSLYLYREGGIDEDTMVKGVPVLFIPGNAGSYKQVRPIAAEAANYFRDTVEHDADALRAGTRNLDFFTADFNEDITAFHGQTLLDQAEYLNDAVAYILSLYPDPRRSSRDPGLPDPSSVILVGHSMGGIVARTMLIMPNYQSNSINTIVTMSAPHVRPPVSFDSDLVHTYKRMNDYWRQAYSQKWASDNPLWHVTLISIAGGGLDTVVPSDYASLSSLVPETHGFTVFTSSVPNVWTGADHLSILWCDQFRKILARSLIEVVDVNRQGQTKQRAERMRIFRRWFLTGMEAVTEKTLPHNDPTTLLTLEDNSNSIISSGERFALREFGDSGKPKAYLMPIPPQATASSKRFSLLSDQRIDSSGGGGKLEVLFCSVFPLQAGQSAAVFAMNMDLSGASSGSTRLACKNAASDVISLPASTTTSKNSFDERDPFSYLQYSLNDLNEHQFVAIVDKCSSLSSGWVIAEFSDSSDSQIQTKTGLRRLLTMGMDVVLPAMRPIVTEIKIPALHSSLLAYKLKVGPQVCGDSADLFTPLLRQYITEPYESKYFVNVKEANINLHSIAPFMPPPLPGHQVNEGVSLQLWSDPTCNTSIDVSLRVDFAGSVGKLVMRYRTIFFAFPILIVALVLRKQFSIYDNCGVFITFAESLDLCLRSSLPILLLAMVFLGMSLTSSQSSATSPRSSSLLHWGGNGTESIGDYTKNDILMGSSDPFFWFLVPLAGLLSTAVCVVVNYAALLVIHMFCVIYSFFNARPAWLRNDDRRHNMTPAFAAISPRRRAITTSILLFMVSTIIPYQFAYMVACIVQIATCTRALLFAKETQSGIHYNFYNYAHSILVLMLWILPINLPVLAVWVHNLAVHWLTPFSSHHNVLSIMPFIILIETLTGGKMIPRVTTKFRYITNTLFFLLAALAGIYGVTYAYLLHYLANFVCAWLVVIHFSSNGFSISSLNQMLDVEETEGHIKKRP